MPRARTSFNAEFRCSRKTHINFAQLNEMAEFSKLIGRDGNGLNLSTALRQWPISNYRGDWFSHDRKEFWGLSGTDHHAIVGGGGQMIVKPEAGRVRFIHKGDPFLWEVVSDK